MKQLLLVLLFTSVVYACEQPDKNASQQDSPISSGKKLENQTDRRIQLIQALKNIRMRIASGDKEKIAGIFTFPLSTASFSIYTHDSLFNAQVEKNNGNISRDLFLQFFGTIATSIQLDEVQQLFLQLDIHQLNAQNMVKKEVIHKTKPCYPFYAIEIEDKKVKLTMGGSVNRNFDTKSASAEAVEENSSEYCEHVLWWVFEFDGSHLVLTEISGAG